MQVTQRYKTGKTYLVRGVEFTVSNDTKAIGWMSDWTKANDLDRDGTFRHVFHGPNCYGAVSYYLNVEGWTK